jgi:hypothetical protein
MPVEAEKVQKPPYGSFATLQNQLQKLDEHGLPNQIDSSLFRSLSGSTVGVLLSTLRYLNFIDDAGKPTGHFVETLEALNKDEASQKAAWAKVVRNSYPFMFDGRVPLGNATTSQVEQAFRDQGITGSTITKAVSFFLSAAEAAGIEVSKHVKVPKPKPQGSRVAKKKTREASGAADPTPQTIGRVSSDGLHPFVRGLLQELPTHGQSVEFALAKRVNWLEIAARTFDMIYQRSGEDDSKRIVISLE